MTHPTEDFLKEKALLLKEICEDFGFRKEVEEVKKTLSRLENPFLITVFGEVNAGKSSFINALLKIPDLCRTDVDICTDRITVLKYCPDGGRRKLDDLTEEVCVNNPLLKGFVVVDTPGINSVLEHHTYITERFLPESDAIIAVLPATNPHTRPLWDWVKRISKFHGKRLVFVLQQADLVKDEKNLQKLIRRVGTYARESGVSEPKVFAVSALKELKGENGNFEPLRKYLEKHFTGERQKKAKLEGVKNELVNLYRGCIEKLENLEREAQNQKHLLEETLNLIRRRKREAEEYKKLLLEAVENKVNELLKKVLFEIDNLSTVDLIFRKGRVRETLNRIERELSEELKHFAEETLVPRLELFEKGVLGAAVEEASKRIREFETFLQKVGSKSVPSKGREAVERTLKGEEKIETPSGEGVALLVGGSLLAGAILTLFGGSLIVDITGGIVSALGLTLGSLYLARKRKALEREIEKLFKKRIEERLKKELSKLVERRISETLGVMEGYLKDRLSVAEKELSRIREAKDKLLKVLSELRKREVDR